MAYQLPLLAQEVSAVSDDNATPAQLRQKKVLQVLQAAKGPIGPTEIARIIGEEWCAPKGGYPLSSAITPICRRLGLSSVKGKYQLPQA